MKPSLYTITTDHKIIGIGILYTDKTGTVHDIVFERKKWQIIDSVEFQKAIDELKGK